MESAFSRNVMARDCLVCECQFAGCDAILAYPPLPFLFRGAHVHWAYHTTVRDSGVRSPP